LGKTNDLTAFNTQLANHKFKKMYPRDNERKIYVHDFIRRGMDDEMWKMSKKAIDSIKKEKVVDKVQKPKNTFKKLRKQMKNEKV
jgi:hypothetical protein